MKKKNNDTSANNPTISKKPSDNHVAEYAETRYDIQHLCESYVSRPQIRRYAEKMIELVTKKKKILTMNSLSLALGLNRRDLQRWKEKYPEIAEAYTYVKATLAARREEGGLRRELDRGMILFNQCKYDDEFREVEEERATRKERIAEKENATQKIVIMDKWEVEKKEKKDKE